MADTHVRPFRANLVSLFDQNQFQELDSIAQQLRSQRLRFKGGGWQINAYYAQLGEGLLEYVGPLVETRVQEKPLSIALREISERLLTGENPEAWRRPALRSCPCA